MTGDAVRHVVEAFFRRWPFYALILIAALVLGALNVSRTVDNYTSRGSIFVESQSLVSAQSGVGNGGILSFLTPAQFTGQELNGLLSTEVFMEAVVEQADIDLVSAPAARSQQLNQLRRSVSLSASSENLLAINVTTVEPQLSADLAEAIIAEFISFQIAVDIAESGASEEFFTGLAADYEQDVLTARRAVDSALRNVESLELLTPEEQRELERLQSDEALAVSKFQAAVEDVETSRLVSLQTETDVRQSYSVFDPPQVPGSPEDTLLDDLTVIVSFLIAGGLLVAIGPIASALLNRAVLFPDDLDLGEVKVMATLPKIRKRALRLDKASTDEPGPDDEVIGGVATVARQTITFLPDAPDVPIQEPVAKPDTDTAPAAKNTAPAAKDTAPAAKNTPTAAKTPAPAETAAKVQPKAAPATTPTPVEDKTPAPAETAPAKKTPAPTKSTKAAKDAAEKRAPASEKAAAPAADKTADTASTDTDIMDLGDALLEVTDLNDLDWDDDADGSLTDSANGNGSSNGNGTKNGKGDGTSTAKAKKGSSHA